MSRNRHILPGFNLSVGYTITYLSLIVIIPFAALAWKASGGGIDVFVSTLTNKQVLASLKLSFTASFIAALVSGFFGVLTAWAMERYTFPGKRILDAMVDLPFALPTAVAGIALCSLYGQNGWIGSLLEPLGIKVAYTPIGVTVALIFIGFPFVVRTVQPIIQGLSLEVEEAAACLGASRWQTFTKVIIPTLLPSSLAGMTLAFGRAVGEYGSVVFISGNLPFKTEIAPLLIVTRLEQYNYTGAAALGVILLVISFTILLLSNLFQAWNSKIKA
ncbi:sulfate ABC transporter permease subunit CysT [Phragmitibacter flavus]|uniref:Sulfate transport system permease protein CysT n=1 Tax=Phragmitibacter flavus TaxID=2576071 RepID=A0A5R8KIJ2_9BACT|nr:sulfate ABC transporter permease subunit CysT [Phragmitibacter flavus]TLD72070.1 sulfate ABC transporter permease subunit CysT [Phragmitibacter flavus]